MREQAVHGVYKIGANGVEAGGGRTAKLGDLAGRLAGDMDRFALGLSVPWRLGVSSANDNSTGERKENR